MKKSTSPVRLITQSDSSASTHTSIELFRTADGAFEMPVRFGEETAWLTQAQMAELFGRDQSIISRHIRNAEKDGEIDPQTMYAKNAYLGDNVARRYEVVSYNLDVIISVGYRVKSLRGVEFRRWATRVLREYIMKGYAIRNEKDGSFKSALGAVYQSFGGKDLYPSAQEKAANLLYLVTKNHGFSDGNKRIAAGLFLYFLSRNRILLRKAGTKRIADHTLVALTVMIAESRPAEKETMVNLVMQFLG